MKVSYLFWCSWYQCNDSLQEAHSKLWSDDQFNHRFTVHLHQFVSSFLIQAAGSWGGASFTVTWPGRKVLGDLTWKKATLALERNESGGANPCPTCAQMYGCLKNYYFLILPWLESPVQICCLVAVSLLSHVFRSRQHRTMLDYVFILRHCRLVNATRDQT